MQGVLIVSATGGGTLQAYYDDGAGFREELSARATIEPGTTPTWRRFLALPAGASSDEAGGMDPGRVTKRAACLQRGGAPGVKRLQ